jgi:hypothetical protein
MKLFSKPGIKTAIAMLALAVVSTGCVIATGGPESKPGKAGSAVAGGADHCEQSSDGKVVACGGRSTICQQSSDGHMVVCGGMASYCEKSSDGKAVACGGAAPFCERSGDGRQVTCGGASR